MSSCRQLNTVRVGVLALLRVAVCDAVSPRPGASARDAVELASSSGAASGTPVSSSSSFLAFGEDGRWDDEPEHRHHRQHRRHMRREHGKKDWGDPLNTSSEDYAWMNSLDITNTSTTTTGSSVTAKTWTSTTGETSPVSGNDTVKGHQEVGVAAVSSQESNDTALPVMYAGTTLSNTTPSTTPSDTTRTSITTATMTPTTLTTSTASSTVSSTITTSSTVTATSTTTRTNTSATSSTVTSTSTATSATSTSTTVTDTTVTDSTTTGTTTTHTGSSSTVTTTSTSSTRTNTTTTTRSTTQTNTSTSSTQTTNTTTTTWSSTSTLSSSTWSSTSRTNTTTSSTATTTSKSSTSMTSTTHTGSSTTLTTNTVTQVMAPAGASTTWIWATIPTTTPPSTSWKVQFVIDGQAARNDAEPSVTSQPAASQSAASKSGPPAVTDAAKTSGKWPPNSNTAICEQLDAASTSAQLEATGILGDLKNLTRMCLYADQCDLVVKLDMCGVCWGYTGPCDGLARVTSNADEGGVSSTADEGKVSSNAAEGRANESNEEAITMPKGSPLVVPSTPRPSSVDVDEAPDAIRRAAAKEAVQELKEAETVVNKVKACQTSSASPECKKLEFVATNQSGFNDCQMGPEAGHSVVGNDPLACATHCVNDVAFFTVDDTGVCHCCPALDITSGDLGRRGFQFKNPSPNATRANETEESGVLSNLFRR